MSAWRIDVLSLFEALDKKLIDLLRSLTSEEWQSSTRCAEWNVKDIAAHLLDGNIRRLSAQRDDHFGEPFEGNSSRELVHHLNKMNAQWISASKRMSPEVITDLLEITGREVHLLFVRLDPEAPALFPVSWAGDRSSPNWFDIAREYNEKWLHQQQIRTALNKPGILDRKFGFPAMDILIQGLPHTYREVVSEKKNGVKIKITGKAGGEWYLIWNGKEWVLQNVYHGDLKHSVAMDANTAWKLFSKGISKEEAAKSIRFQGDEKLTRPVLNLVSVMA